MGSALLLHLLWLAETLFLCRDRAALFAAEVAGLRLAVRFPKMTGHRSCLRDSPMSNYIGNQGTVAAMDSRNQHRLLDGLCVDYLDVNREQGRNRRRPRLHRIIRQVPCKSDVVEEKIIRCISCG